MKLLPYDLAVIALIAGGVLLMCSMIVDHDLVAYAAMILWLTVIAICLAGIVIGSFST